MAGSVMSRQDLLGLRSRVHEQLGDNYVPHTRRAFDILGQEGLVRSLEQGFVTSDSLLEYWKNMGALGQRVLEAFSGEGSGDIGSFMRVLGIVSTPESLRMSDVQQRLRIIATLTPYMFEVLAGDTSVNQGLVQNGLKEFFKLRANFRRMPSNLLNTYPRLLRYILHAPQNWHHQPLIDPPELQLTPNEYIEALLSGSVFAGNEALSALRKARLVQLAIGLDVLDLGYAQREREEVVERDLMLA